MQRNASAARLRAYARRYGAAVALTLLVVLGRFTLDPWWGREHNRHLVFLPAIILAAYWGGFGPGLVATVISTFALDYFWTKAAFHPSVEVVLFFLIGLAVCALIDSLHRARARADAARKAREQILAIVAHDLRNPLQAVRMTSAMLQRKPPGPELLVHQLKTIDRANARMENLIRDLVDATRIEHEELTIAPREEGLGSIVREAADSFGALAQDKELTVEVGPPVSDPVVWCDRERILQVLGNLLGNAVRFTPDGGRITLALRDERDRIRVEVKDTGPGIKPEHLPYIFDRYWNADGKGTGLGLFIAKSIVHAHGSRLEVTGEPGRGAIFFFSLLRVPEAGHATESRDQAGSRPLSAVRRHRLRSGDHPQHRPRGDG